MLAVLPSLAAWVPSYLLEELCAVSQLSLFPLSSEPPPSRRARLPSSMSPASNLLRRIVPGVRWCADRLRGSGVCLVQPFRM